MPRSPRSQNPEHTRYKIKHQISTATGKNSSIHAPTSLLLLFIRYDRLFPSLQQVQLTHWRHNRYTGAAKLARRQRSEKKCGPRERGRKLKHRATRRERGGCFAHLFLLFYTTLIRLLNEILVRLGSPGY